MKARSVVYASLFAMAFVSCPLPPGMAPSPFPNSSATPTPAPTPTPTPSTSPTASPTEAPSPSPSSGPSDLDIIGDILGLVDADQIMGTVLDLSGERATTIGGSSYTIATRNTNSGEPIQKATQYAYEKLSSYGYAVQYQDWNTNYRRNVIGTKTGSSQSGQAIVLCAHIDCMPTSGRAPGADDNASGCAALLECARILSDREFECSIVFALFSGQEQGLYGSAAFVAGLDPEMEVIAAVDLNHVGWNTSGSAPTMRVHTRTTASPQYPLDKAIADIFVSMDAHFSLPITPTIDPDGEVASDHSSFWNAGIPAILVIEDDANDFNPYYHTTSDTYDRIDLPFLTGIAKAAIATVSSMADPINE